MVRFEQRNLNNAFAYDLVPAPSVLTAALKAARRVNDFPTAGRIFEGMYIVATHTSGYVESGIARWLSGNGEMYDALIADMDDRYQGESRKQRPIRPVPRRTK